MRSGHGRLEQPIDGQADPEASAHSDERGRHAVGPDVGADAPPQPRQERLDGRLPIVRARV